MFVTNAWFISSNISNFNSKSDARFLLGATKFTKQRGLDPENFRQAYVPIRSMEY